MRGVAIVSPVRTAVGSFGGTLVSTSAAELGSIAIKEVLQRTGLDAEKVDDVIMGHKNIGYIAKAGRVFQERKRVKEGDLVFVEHYLPCFACEWCHQGDYRLCIGTDWRNNPDALRYGYTSAERAPHLWGGFAQYMYLPWNALVHKVPDQVSP